MFPSNVSSHSPLFSHSLPLIAPVFSISFCGPFFLSPHTVCRLYRLVSRSSTSSGVCPEDLDELDQVDFGGPRIGPADGDVGGGNGEPLPFGLVDDPTQPFMDNFEFENNEEMMGVDIPVDDDDDDDVFLASGDAGQNGNDNSASSEPIDIATLRELGGRLRRISDDFDASRMQSSTSPFSSLSSSLASSLSSSPPRSWSHLMQHHHHPPHPHHHHFPAHDLLFNHDYHNANGNDADDDGQEIDRRGSDEIEIPRVHIRRRHPAERQGGRHRRYGDIEAVAGGDGVLMGGGFGQEMALGAIIGTEQLCVDILSNGVSGGLAVAGQQTVNLVKFLVIIIIESCINHYTNTAIYFNHNHNPNADLHRRAQDDPDRNNRDQDSMDEFLD